MLWLVYNLIFPLIFLLMMPKFISRMLRRGGYRKHFEQRVGLYGKGTTARFKAHRHIWIHAVSVGEINLAMRFIDAYRDEHADARFVVSVNTSTAHAIGLRSLDARDTLIYFPVDLPFVMAKVMRSIRPLKIILVECEYWPNMLRQANRRGIPISLINGRVSDSSYKGYLRVRFMFRRLLELINPICVQSEQDLNRMIDMGAPADQVACYGTAKYDVPPPDAESETLARAVLKKTGVGNSAIILTGGSTWDGEEAILCQLYKRLKTTIPNLFLVLAPRHVERREEVQRTLNEQGLSYALRSMDDDYPLCPDVLVVDTTGELMHFYAVSDVVFVGKSLCHRGGQNPIEPALFGKPVVVGPNMGNFPAVMNDFLACDAIRQVADAEELERVMAELLSNSAMRAELGTAALGVVESRRGAVRRMVQAIG